MSWFTDFLTDTARQAAPGIHQAINSDIQRKQRLGELEAQIPLLVKQQEALMPGRMRELEAKEQADMRAIALREALKAQFRAEKPPDPSDAARGELARYVENTGTVNIPWNPDMGAEGEVPLGGAPTQIAHDPLKVLSLGVKAKQDVNPIMRQLFPAAQGADTDRNTYTVDLGDKVLLLDRASNAVVREYPRVRSAGAGQGFQNMFGAAFYREGKEKFGMTDTEAVEYANKKLREQYAVPMARDRAAATVEGGYTGPAREAKAATAFRTGEERAAGAVQGELRQIASPSTPGVMVSGAAAVGEQRERGKIPTQVEKKTAELERTYSLIDQIDALSKPLITARNWQEVLPQYVRLKVGSFTNANQAATLYESTIEEFLGQLAREVSQERGVLTNQDIGRIKSGLPSFGNTEGVRSGKIALLKNIIRMNQEAEIARTASGGRISEEARQSFRSDIDRMLQQLGQGSASRTAPVAPQQETKMLNGKTYIKVNGRWYEQ